MPKRVPYLFLFACWPCPPRCQNRPRKWNSLAVLPAVLRNSPLQAPHQDCTGLAAAADIAGAVHGSTDRDTVRKWVSSMILCRVWHRFARDSILITIWFVTRFPLKHNIALSMISFGL